VLDRRFAGTASHLAARKRAVRACGDEFVAQHPAGQIAVLGAGCDGTGVEWARRAPRLRVLLSDRPASLENLLRAQVGTALPPNLRFVPAELPATAPWTHLAWDRDRPTLVLAEGLAMYLGGRDTLRTLQRLRDHHRAALHVLGSCLEPSLHALPRGVGAVQKYLRRTGHPGFRWALPAARVEAALARFGFALADTPKLPDFVDPSYGERLFVATRVVADRPTG